MYENHFGIRKKPFSIAPDPRFLYMSDGHREALAHLRYGMENEGGFVLLTGDVGTGKTTVCRCLLEQVPQDTDVAYILNPKVTVDELLATICDELDGSHPLAHASVKDYVDQINAHLLEAHGKGRRTVLIIDEAQNLDSDVLEQIRLLTNLETNQQKLLQIILLGQPELQEKLESKELYQLSQRIAARFHLGPLNKKETKAYVRHRLLIAGFDGSVFSEASYAKLFQLSGGVPRVINMIGDRALLGAFAREKRFVEPKIIEQAAREVFGEKGIRKISLFSVSRWTIVLITFFAVALLVGLIVYNHAPEKTVSNLKGSSSQVVATPERDEIKPKPSEIAGNQIVVKKEAPSPVTVPKWPVGKSAEDSEDQAFRGLFSLWGISYSSTMGWPCQVAEKNGLYCLSDQRSFSALDQLNRPTVLLMLNDHGEEFSVVFSRLENDRATVQIGPEHFDIALDNLTPLWTGRFILFWRPPPGYQGSFRLGHRGKDVAWLSRKMDRIEGRLTENRNPADRYDDELVRRVKWFQRENGLAQDGIAGKETLIMVNSKTADDIPFLHD